MAVNITHIQTHALTHRHAYTQSCDDLMLAHKMIQNGKGMKCSKDIFTLTQQKQLQQCCPPCDSCVFVCLYIDNDIWLTSVDLNKSETCYLIFSKMILRHLEEIRKLNTQLFLLMSCPPETWTHTCITTCALIHACLSRDARRNTCVNASIHSHKCTFAFLKWTDAAPLEAQRPSSCSPASQMGNHW